MLLCSITDVYFQKVIQCHKHFSDKVLELIKKECANIGTMDKSYFHEELTKLWIKDKESVTSFLKCFQYMKSNAEAASNSYTNDQLVDFILTGMRGTTESLYKTAIQLYMLERKTKGNTLTFSHIKENLFELNEQLGHDKRAT
jgi:hypothetical protein